MARTQASQRRRRTDDDLDDEDRELYASTPKNKRQRTVADDEEEEDEEEDVDDEGPLEQGSQSPEGSLLPDSFRRSPKGNGRVAGQHQPGSIVRVRLKDFVTYTNAEFNPGPNLNMVIGPNGTGKSTLVCAICLGLGWEPSHLGRQKNIGDFVKNGQDKGEIEIELAADPKRQSSNPIVTTKITRQGNKSDFLINGKKETKKAVLKLMRSFSIQVDNLCQFLPQDRVAEFARLSPIELLAQTQRAAAPPEMCEWHESLKTMRKEQKRKLNEQQVIMEELKVKEKRQQEQEEIVQRLNERKEWQARVAALEKLRPFPQYRLATEDIQRGKGTAQGGREGLRPVAETDGAKSAGGEE